MDSETVETNSFKEARKRLVRIFEDNNNHVVALSGKWGVGKTYLWQSTFQREGGKAFTKNYVSISLFGVKTCQELKLRLVQQVVGENEGAKQIKEIIAKGVGALAKKFLPGAPIEDLVLLALPKLLNGMVVVIDDIERKHKNLDIDEVLGFVNEYVENYKVRFLLSLSSDNLVDKEVWKVFHEKIIDAEIVYAPNPADALEIARRKFSFEYIDVAERTIKALAITNVRVICRILTNVKDFLWDFQPLEITLAHRSIPSIVLLSVIHFQGKSIAITSEEVLGYSPKNSESLSKWFGFMQGLGIDHCDEFEVIANDFIIYGTLKVERLRNYISHFLENKNSNEVNSAAEKFITNCHWDANFDPTKTQGGDKLDYFLKHICEFNDAMVCALARSYAYIGNISAEKRLVERWVDLVKAVEGDRNKFFAVNVEGVNIYNEIQVERDAWRASNNGLPTLELVILSYQKDSKDGDLNLDQLRVIQEATVADYESTIRSLKPGSLNIFLGVYFSIIDSSVVVNAVIIDSKPKFIYACKNINVASPNSGLARILMREFKRRGEDVWLNQKTDAAPE